MGMKPTVSVIIPAYNASEYIEAAIESVLAQTYPIYELIIVNDGSTDDLEAVVRNYVPPATYISQTNKGVCAARNSGIDAAKGDLIAFLDSDDTWEPTKLEKQIAIFDDDKELGLVHCGLREFDGATGDTIKYHLVGGEGWVARDLALYDKPVVPGPGGSIIVKRNVIENVGCFDPSLTNGEDWEFCMRVALKYRFGFVAEPLVNYRSHAGNASKNLIQMERSTLMAWGKVFGTSDREILKLERRSYSNLFKILAGSYLQSGQYCGFLRNVLKSLIYRPTLVSYYLRTLSERLAKVIQNKDR